jgi:hypothetical protein
MIQALVALLKPPPARFAFSRLGEADWHGLLRLAGESWLLGALDWRCGVHDLRARLPEAVRDYIDGAAILVRDRTARQCAEIAWLAREFHGAGLRAVFLKGSVAQVTALYPDPGARICADIDLLLTRDNAEAAFHHLRRLGYTPQIDEPVAPGPLIGDHPLLRHLYRLIHPDRSFGVELHFSLDEGALKTVLPPDEVLAAAETLMIDGTPITIPRHDHRIIHCVLHMLGNYAAGERIALRQLLELGELVARPGAQPDWTAISARFDRANGRLGLEFCLLTAHHLVGLSPPPIGYSLSPLCRAIVLRLRDGQLTKKIKRVLQARRPSVELIEGLRKIIRSAAKKT